MIKAENTVRFRRRKLGLGHARNLRRVGEPPKPLSAFFKLAVTNYTSISMMLTFFVLCRFAQDVRDGERLPGALDDVQGSVIEQSRVIATGWKALSEEDRAVGLLFTVSRAVTDLPYRQDYVKDAETRQAAYVVEKQAFVEKTADA